MSTASFKYWNLIQCITVLRIYSPDLNPIEKMWPKMKSFLRKRKVCVAAELPEAVKAALETISTNDCKGWFHASGICVN